MKSCLEKSQGCGRQGMPDHRGQDAVYIVVIKFASNYNDCEIYSRRIIPTYTQLIVSYQDIKLKRKTK